MSLSFFLFLLGSLTLLTACTTAPAASSSTPSLKEKTVSTANDTTAPKRIMDGSRHFTLPEIEERLLKVLALPPAQISKESVGSIFGVELIGEEGGYMEEISEDRQVVFNINAFRYPPGSMAFEYVVSIKKTREDGLPILGDQPREIPVAYKFAYSEFVQKLEGLGWKADGEYRNVGHYWNYFVKDDFLMKLHIDTYAEGANGQPDYSRTGISRIVIDAPNKR